MDVLVGTAAAIRVDFATPTGMQIPDAGSVKYSLFDHVGTSILADQLIPVSAGETGVAIEIVGTSNTIAPTRKFEKRTLAVSWKVSGQSYQHLERYRIIPLPPYSVTPQDVRTFFGYSEDELYDSEVDLFEAYLALNTKLDLTEFLTSGTDLENLVNEGIMLTAAISLIPSLRIRTPKESSSGTDTFSRFASSPDFDALALMAITRLAEIEGDLGITTSNPVTPLILLLTSPTDAITGA